MGDFKVSILGLMIFIVVYLLRSELEGAETLQR